LDQPGDAEQILAAFAAGHPAPRTVKGPARGGDRSVHIGLIGLGDLGQHRLVGRVDRLERGAGAVDELAVDKHLGTTSRSRAGFARFWRRCVVPIASVTEK